MNYRHPKAILVVRILLGLFLLMSGIGGFLAGDNMEGIPQNMIDAVISLKDMGLFQMIKVTEIVAGIMLVVGYLPALALLFVAPIGIGVVVFNSQLSPANLPAGLILCALTAYLGYAYWDKYKAIFNK